MNSFEVRLFLLSVAKAHVLDHLELWIIARQHRKTSVKLAEKLMFSIEKKY